MAQPVPAIQLRLSSLLLAVACAFSLFGCTAIATFDACKIDSDCPHAMVCSASICRDTCQQDSDCGVGFACASEVCLPLHVTGDAGLGASSSDAAGIPFSPAADAAQVPASDAAPAVDTAPAGDAAPRHDAATGTDFGAAISDVAAPCTPRDCGSAGAQCGLLADGCGSVIECGGCQSPHFCGANHTCHTLQLEFRTVAAGTFGMGSSTSEPGRDSETGIPASTLDETLHLVQLTHGFEIADSEVTQRDFEDVMGYNPSLLSGCGGDCPVERLTWHEAAAFCNALSLSRGLPRCFDCSGSGSAVHCQLAAGYDDPYRCPGYRLPTEAEWEYAARAASQTATHLGDLAQLGCRPADSTLNQIAWYLGNATAPTYAGGVNLACDGTATQVGTHPLRSKNVANGFGLYDMIGNVWEWVLDCQGHYPTASQRDPVGPLNCGGQDRIIRGCAADSLARQCRSAERKSWPCGSDRCWNTGFRPVRTTS